MSLIKIINTRYEIAKSFTKCFHDDIKRAIDDYEAQSPNDGKTGRKTGVYNRHVASSRYEMTIPYIFATHESMISSFFENMPDIVITGRTAAEEKSEMMKAIYEYLKDKADLDEFLGISAWWFFLVGMVNATVEFKTKIGSMVPQLDVDGSPMLDEHGEDVGVPVYEYNDPIATVDNPLKVYYSPESEFSIDGHKIPYYLKERLIDVDEIKDVYKVDVDPDQKLDVDVDVKESDNDLKRARVLYYYGSLPREAREDLKKKGITWAYDAIYAIACTKDKILSLEEEEEKPCKLARMYATQNKFFGFGIGKTLRPFQEDMSIRRSQQLAYADRFSFPWLTVSSETKVDQKALADFKKSIPLTWNGDKPPAYLVPPPMPAIVAESDNAVRGDAQFVSGTLDLSKGAQQTNTVKTATGQQLFAQSQDKRLNKARKSLAKYYREVVIKMFKLLRDNMSEDEEKKIVYTNDDGSSEEMIVTKSDLENIDFDTDVDFNLDSVSVNKDTESQRWLSLLDLSANLTFADQQKIYMKVLRESFRITNPEDYIVQEGGTEQSPEQDIPPSGDMSNTQNSPMSQDSLLGQHMSPDAPYVG